LDGSAVVTLLRDGWLAGQPERFRDWIIRAGHVRRVRRGQSLYVVGDEPDALYGLIEGSLSVELPLVGEEPVTLHRARPGTWIGESALLGGGPRTISVHVVADGSVLRVPRGSIEAVLQREPAFWRSFYALTHLNGTLAVTVLAEVLSLTPRARLARILLRLRDDRGRVEATQSDLAALLGMTRSSLQRALADLKTDGAVSQEFAAIMVLDSARLRGLSSES
jgi:CRP-like cAMP-binding protein